MASVCAVIMAGGKGERFWPLSTEERSKPFIPLLGESTLLQETVKRLLPLVPAERILISIGETQRVIARQQLPGIPEENFVVEPVGRDTAACLGFCALHLERRDPDAVMLAVPADHYIGDTAAFCRTLQRGFANLEGANGVVFGVRPTRPETGYGYIETGAGGSEASFLDVVRFVEKPDPDTAGAYLRSGRHFWNSGMFLWRNRTLLDLFREHRPKTYEGLSALRALIGRSGAEADLLRVFSSLEKISIDYALLEKIPRLRMVPAEFDWDDIGNWSALARALSPDALGNVCRGEFAALEANGCVGYTDSGAIALFGVTDLVVVQAHGTVLVCPRKLAPELKRLVAALPEREGWR